MKKILSFLTVAILWSVAVNAGGLLTNTNQNAAYVRQMSQNGIIDITGLYANPAGTAFLTNGWHLSLNSQSAWQQRNIKTEFPLFAGNVNDPELVHKFGGSAKAPVIPSISVSYNHDKWSVFAHFALGGGGGKCEFLNGLGTFESLYAGQIFANPDIRTALAGANALYGSDLMLRGYSIESYMSGTSYHFGLTLGGTYNIADNVSLAAGVRFVYAYCKYQGYVRDINVVAASAGGEYKNVAEAVSNRLSNEMDTKGIAMDCKQNGFDVTPILGIDWKINEKWNMAAKYEFKTGLKLKNDSRVEILDETVYKAGQETLDKFKDGAEIAEDIPAILTLGLQYKPLESLRLMGGWHYYFDKSASKYGQTHLQIDNNTQEFNAGFEYDLCKYLTLSGSWQTTRYGLSDNYMNDLSFNLTNNMVGCGVRINCSKTVNIDLGYMHTFYQDRNVETMTAAGVKKDLYNRTNKVFAFGVNINL